MDITKREKVGLLLPLVYADFMINPLNIQLWWNVEAFFLYAS